MKVIDDGLLEHSPLRESAPAMDASTTVGRLFHTHARRLARLLSRSLRNRDDVQDASQEVFLRLWRRERAGQLRDEAVAYMHSAALTVAIDSVRRRHARGTDRTVDAELDDLEYRAAGIEEELHWREGVTKLVTILQELPIVTQQVFILYHFEGLMHVDIAARLGISLRSVERHMANALASCRERLGDYL